MNGLAFYNEIDPFAADWLEQLIAVGSICPGVVDRRDIRDILPSDLDGFSQVHFFAGIGGWSYALHLAGWPDDRAVWTGSCPCQPFSAAGKGGGFADERDLWPAEYHLICECQPATVFGEQVDDNAAWLDRAASDLEREGYAFGAVDLPACAIDAPHDRMRSFYVAHADGAGRGEQGGSLAVVSEFVASQRASRRSFFGDHQTAGELGRLRRSKPGIQLVAHGVPNRVGTLRGAGNAIVPQVAATFIGAAMNAIAPSLPIVEAAE